MEATDSEHADMTPAQTSGAPPGKLSSIGLALLLLAFTQIALFIHLAPHLFPDSAAYAWVGPYEHHFWQMVIALGAIGLLSRGRFAEWGLNLRNAGLSWRILWKFCIVYALIVLGVDAIPAFVQHSADLGFLAPANSTNMAGWLTFEWLFVGFSEEIVFRGLLQTFLSQSWTGSWKILGVSIPHAGLITTLIFCLAHINPIHPQVNWLQQLYAFGLGIYYSTVYARTRSLLTPILSHNFADGLEVTAAYLLYFRLH